MTAAVLDPAWAADMAAALDIGAPVAQRRAVDVLLGEMYGKHLPGRHNQLDHGRRGRGLLATGRRALAAAPLALNDWGSEFTRGVQDEDLRDQLDPDAFDQYRGGAHEDINGALRAAADDPDDAPPIPDEVPRLDFALDKSRLTSDVEVYRGVQDVRFFGAEPGRSLKGLEFVEDGYLSTTADKAVAEEFFEGDGAVLRIRVPAGVGAVQLSSWAGPGAGARSVHEESELLMQRGLRIRIVGDRVVGGVRQLTAEVVV